MYSFLQGLATAPTLFAAEEFPEIREIIQRRFGEFIYIYIFFICIYLYMSVYLLSG